MTVLIDRVKRATATGAMNQVARLFGKCSDETLVKLWKVFEKIASNETDKKEARKMRWLIETEHPFGQWLKLVSRRLTPKARRCFITNVYGNAWFLNRTGPRKHFIEQYGYNPPDLIVIDVTQRCNLSCEGCWAGSYSLWPDMEMPIIERIIEEGMDDLGIHFYVLTGGEPFIRKDIFDIFHKYPHCQFQLYTNGMMINDAVADRLADAGNAMPMISVEGFKETTDARRGENAYEKTTGAMKRLRDRGVLFGFSVTATRHNVEEISSEEFIQEMIDMGCLYGWYFQYVPVGREPDMNLMVTAEQRDHLRRRVYELRNSLPIVVADFWNDGPEVDGCMAGGKRYFHVNCNGDIEPCVFCHFATHNIKTSTLVDALNSPFFTAIRKGIPYDGNTLRACMLIDRPQVFRKYAERFKPYPTHPGSESLVESLAEPLDAHAADVKEIYDRAWAEHDWMRMYPDPPEDYN